MNNRRTKAARAEKESAEKAQRRRERDAKRAEKKAQIVARQEDRLKKSCQGDHSEDAQVPVCQGGSKWVSCDKCDSFYLCKKQCRSWPWLPRKTQEKQDTTTQETQDARLHRAQGQPKTQVNDPKKTSGTSGQVSLCWSFYVQLVVFGVPLFAFCCCFLTLWVNQNKPTHTKKKKKCNDT